MCHCYFSPERWYVVPYWWEGQISTCYPSEVWQTRSPPHCAWREILRSSSWYKKLWEIKPTLFVASHSKRIHELVQKLSDICNNNYVYPQLTLISKDINIPCRLTFALRIWIVWTNEGLMVHPAIAAPTSSSTFMTF
jgi:hypothetical protein